MYLTKFLNYFKEVFICKLLSIKDVQFGQFGGKHLVSLLRLTSGLYAPLFFGNKTWPDSKYLNNKIKFEFLKS
jgi:hypothetical protein